MDSIPGWGTKIPHATEQLSQNYWAHMPERKILHDATRNQNNQISKYISKKKKKEETPLFPPSLLLFLPLCQALSQFVFLQVYVQKKGHGGPNENMTSTKLRSKVSL